MSWTDSGHPQELRTMPSETDLPLLDLQGLRQLVHFCDQLRHAGRLPQPRRRTRRPRAERRKLPPNNP
jgi:hypothetical protein